ncbi:MAG: hypothetical protein IJQ11_01210 [Bacteroidales bacterium]|nr:hypothetical protein [Bacteroidales bacterium]
MSSSHPIHSPAPYVVKCCHDLRLFVPDNLVPGNDLRRLSEQHNTTAKGC